MNSITNKPLAASMAPTINISLIHNHDAARLSLIRPAIYCLQQYLGGEAHCKILESSFQPELKPHPWALALKRDVIYAQLGYAWSFYRGYGHTPVRSTLGFLKRFFGKYVFNYQESRNRWFRSSAIEVFVSAKHVRMWEAFLESDAELLICFEDDALFNDESHQQFLQHISRLLDNPSENYVYVDFGGGCTLEQLKIDRLQLDFQGGVRRYKRGVTNTACSYLLNRNLAAEFLQVLLNRPQLRLVGIDWMMNALFMEIRRSGGSVECWHCDPPAVQHGSAVGSFDPWQR